jgi:hypothetical protein
VFGTDFWSFAGTILMWSMLSTMLMKAWMPFAPKQPGEKLLEVPLGPWQRLLVHRTAAIVLLLVLIVGSIPGLPVQLYLPGTQSVALVAMVVVYMLPLRYVFTDRGVGINNGVPRLYKAFRRFDVRPGRRWLAGNITFILRGRKTPRGTTGSYALFIPKQWQPEVTRVLKKHVR